MQTHPQAYALYVVRIPKDLKFCRRQPFRFHLAMDTLVF